MPAEDDPARRTLRQRLTSAAVWSATAAMLVVTVVLHALASVTPSPGGTNMQDEVGEQCQRPRLFIGLLAMSSVRHGLALVCSTWVFLRRRRVRKAHDRALRDLVTAIETGRTNVGNANADANANRSGGANADRISYAAASSTHSLPVPITNSPLPRPPPASTSSYYAHSNSTGVYGQRSSMYQRSNTSVVTFATAPSPPPNHNLYKVAEGADTFGSLPPNATIIQPPQAASMPSLILPAHNSTMIYNHAAAASTTSLASQRFSAGSGSVSPAAHLYTFPPPEDTNASASSPRASLIAPTPMASLPSLHPAAAASTHSLAPTGGSSIPMTPARQSIHSLTHHAPASAGMTYPPTPMSARGVPGTPRPASRAAGSRPVSQATRYPEPYVPKSERRKQRNHKWAKLADALATSVLGFLSFWTFALWAIGSGVCIAELPTVTSHSCYNGSPLLWWGVMSSALVFGWLHALYYAWFIIGGFFLILGSSIYIVSHAVPLVQGLIDTSSSPTSWAGRSTQRCIAHALLDLRNSLTTNSPHAPSSPTFRTRPSHCPSRQYTTAHPRPRACTRGRRRARRLEHRHSSRSRSRPSDSRLRSRLRRLLPIPTPKASPCRQARQIRPALAGCQESF